MKLVTVTARQSLNKAYQKEKVSRSEIEKFKKGLGEFLNNIDEKESEEHAKNLVTKFLYDTYYNGKNQINTKGRIDLAIYEDKNPVVIIETKRPKSLEMVTKSDLNKDAMHKLILYYLQERIIHSNIDIKYLVATNIYEWFIFDASVFDKLFYKNQKLTKDFNEWHNKQKTSADRALFYDHIAKPLLDNLKEEIEFTWFDLRDVRKVVKDADTKNDNKLINLYKILSPAHLLKQPFANDSNSLDTKFYAELLHIIGLEEKKDGGKKLIQRKEKPDQGSLLENAINILIAEERLYKLPGNGSAYGESEKERLFNVGLELCITWINRILFLKLLEGQLLTYHSGDSHYKFLNFKTIPNFDELNKLFFQVLARKSEERTNAVREKFERVPYLNSSLFDISPLEDDTLRVNSLDDGLKLELHKSTVLKTENGKKREGELPTLQYLFEFLDAYDFTSEGNEEIQEENKTLINASVLGLIFEKINGYKDGSFFTPGFITMYMCRETIRRAVVQKFNEAKGWKLESFDQLHNEIKDIKEANSIINSLKICDPAVGSGHFLVSALNEMIATKSELRVLSDHHGKLLRDYTVEVTNDELIVSMGDHEFFEYKPGNKESQRVQEALFHEKQTIIENCLFGVDINPNSVKICRLRLWIELLKNAYYTEKSKFKDLETLPNIDINIKQGNSLISRFPLDADLSKALKSIKYGIDDYRGFVNDYKNATDKDAKRGFEKLIEQIKKDFRTEISKNDPKVQQLNKKSGELYSLLNQVSVFELSDKEKKERDKRKEKLESEINKLSAEIDEIKNSVIYKDAFEWRFEFPEVLDKEGKFMGFDAVIGNPPYISLTKLKSFGSHFENGSYDTYAKGADIYCLFYERAIQVLRPNGLLTYITSNSWMRAIYGRPLISYISKNSQPLLLLNIEDTQVFEEATVESNIITLKKCKGLNDFNVSTLGKDYKFGSSLEDYFKSHKFSFKPSESSEWIIGDEIASSLKSKIENGSILLGKLGLTINFGIKTGYNEAFIVDKSKYDELVMNDRKSTEILRSIVRGRDLSKYSCRPSELWMITTFPSLDLNIKHYPAIEKHLLSFGKNRLEQSGNKGSRKKTHNKWFETQDSISYWRDFENPKIIWGEISDDPKFAFDDSNLFAEATTFLMTGKNLKFLLAILNSNVSAWYFNQISTTTGMGTNRWKKYKIQLLPIKEISESKQKPFTNLVDEILKAKKKNVDADTTDLEKEIDQLVYELYGLTEEEIKIVEGKDKTK